MYSTPSKLPVPLSIARCTLSFGIFASQAFSIAKRKRGLDAGSPPPCFAATVISLISLVKILPRWASTRAFLCWIFAHLLCPAIMYFPFQKSKHKFFILTHVLKL